MTSKPKILLIQPNADGTHALTLKGTRWYLRYTQDGEEKSRSLKTESFEQAQGLRDSQYKIWIAEGAKMNVKRGRRKLSVVTRENPDSLLGIYAQDPYIVRIKGKTILQTDDIELAKSTRNKYLEEHPEL